MAPLLLLCLAVAPVVGSVGVCASGGVCVAVGSVGRSSGALCGNGGSAVGAPETPGWLLHVR